MPGFYFFLPGIFFYVFGIDDDADVDKQRPYRASFRIFFMYSLGLTPYSSLKQSLK